MTSNLNNSENGSGVVRTLSDEDWKQLLRRIKMGKCTPFLGAGASAGYSYIPTASCIAEKWAEEHGYPLRDCHDLSSVAQFRAVTNGDDVIPKEDMAQICLTEKQLDFSSQDEIHGVLAELPLPIFITTNYDSFMFDALDKHPYKKPRRELCPWNKFVENYCDSIFDTEPNYKPDISNPLVYHLHGFAAETKSMVLTEDDYLEFLVWFSREWANMDYRVLPAPIVRAFADSSLLFIGYGRTDWSFRVLFRGLIGSLATSSRMKGIAVQLSPLPDASKEERQRAEKYLEDYFINIDKIPMSIYWGHVKDFALELRKRWRDFDGSF